MTLSPGTKLGSFEIAGLIGVGGMGEVYRALDTKLGREAKPLASLDRPKVARIYELEKARGMAFLVMQPVEGRRRMPGR